MQSLIFGCKVSLLIIGHGKEGFSAKYIIYRESAARVFTNGYFRKPCLDPRDPNLKCGPPSPPPRQGYPILQHNRFPGVKGYTLWDRSISVENMLLLFKKSNQSKKKLVLFTLYIFSSLMRNIDSLHEDSQHESSSNYTAIPVGLCMLLKYNWHCHVAYCKMLLLKMMYL
jgi:hypothetical protein